MIIGRQALLRNVPVAKEEKILEDLIPFFQQILQVQEVVVVYQYLPKDLHRNHRHSHYRRNSSKTPIASNVLNLFVAYV